MEKLTVAPDFQALCPTLTDEELRLLEESLVEEGCQHAIVVWKCGKQTIIVDGHNRYAICKQHRLAFKVRLLKVESRQEALGWAARNQLGRRNATEEQKAYLRGKLYAQSKRPVGSPTNDVQLAQNELITTAAVIAEETGVSAATVKRDEKFSEAVDELAEKSQELKDAALRGEIPKSSVAALADAPKSELKKLEKLEGKELREAVRRVTAKAPDYGKCPNCAGTKWDTDEDGVSCAKCHHPHGQAVDEPPPKRKPGQPVIDSRKFKTFEQEIGRCVRMNTELRKHCNNVGKDQSESIRKHLSLCLEELAGWRIAATK